LIFISILFIASVYKSKIQRFPFPYMQFRELLWNSCSRQLRWAPIYYTTIMNVKKTVMVGLKSLLLSWKFRKERTSTSVLFSLCDDPYEIHPFSHLLILCTLCEPRKYFVMKCWWRGCVVCGWRLGGEEGHSASQVRIQGGFLPPPDTRSVRSSTRRALVCSLKHLLFCDIEVPAGQLRDKGTSSPELMLPVKENQW
jgi:hypothetical protein